MRRTFAIPILAVLLLLGLVATLPMHAQMGGSSKGPKQPPPDPSIAYADNSGPWGSWRLMVMNADGTNKTAVTSKGDSLNPDWSPDARRLVFTHRPSRRDAQGIYLINLDGTGLCKLAELRGSSNNPVWSPIMVGGSEWIIYVDYPLSGGNTDLFAVRADCGNPGDPVNLTNSPEGNDWYPSWSRFSNRVAAWGCHGECGVDIYDFSVVSGIPQLSNRTTLLEFGLFEGLSLGAPSWAKDIDRLVLPAYSPATGTLDLWVTDFTVSGTHQLILTPAPGGVANPNWSPTGNEIVVYGSDAGAGIYKLTKQVNADGTETWASTRLAGTGMLPKWRRCGPCS